MAKRISQREIVENRLKETGYVDNYWAIENKVSVRLGAIIHNLQKRGWHFDQERSGYLPQTKNWRYYLRKDLRQPFSPKYRYIKQPNGSMREIENLYPWNLTSN